MTKLFANLNSKYPTDAHRDSQKVSLPSDEREEELSTLGDERMSLQLVVSS